MISAENIHKRYGSLHVLKGVSLTVSQSEIVSIIGPSGAGKSTLLHIIGTLDKPDEGTVKIQNTDISRLKDKELALFRNKHIGFIFQFHHLLPEFSAVENICIPAYIADIPSAKAVEKAVELLKLLGLSERADHKPSQLSGGEQQRVAVARALINDPDIVLADEPSGNLDTQNAEDLHTLFLKLRDQLNQTFVIVTHNQHLAELADRKITLQDGAIVDETKRTMV